MSKLSCTINEGVGFGKYGQKGKGKKMNALALSLHNPQKYSLSEAEEEAKKADEEECWMSFLSRPDILPDRVLNHLRDLEDKTFGDKLWMTVAFQHKVRIYLQKQLAKTEALALAKKLERDVVWEIVLTRPDVEIDCAIKLAGDVRSSCLINVIRMRPDFQRFMTL